MEVINSSIFKQYDRKLFLIGIFFLASAPFLASIILLIPLLAGLRKIRKEILLDFYNYPLIFSVFFMIIKCLVGFYYQTNNLQSWDQSLNWIGLFNWIPLFICFIGFKPYIRSESQRIVVSKVLIASSIPVLLAGFIQYYLKIYGPFQILNGLIIWYQRPIMEGGGITSIFNNPNITGAWLTLIWPLCLSIFLINKRNLSKLKSLITLFIIILFSFCIVLTVSRGAWIGLVIAIPIIFGRFSLNLLIPFLIILLGSMLIPFIFNLPDFLYKFFDLIIPGNIANKFSELILNFGQSPRLDIWRNSVIFIMSKPIFGWGAGTFSILYENSTGIYNNHAHNLFLELSINYGLIVSILIFSTLIILIINSYKKIFMNRKRFGSINDRAWWAGSLIFMISQLYDISSYDLRISITSWLLFAGLREILNDKETNKPISDIIN